MEENPFPDLNVTSADFLDSLSGRSKCSKCQRSRKYYCYTCYVPVPEIEDKVPRVKLPLKVDIIKHRSEVDGKSTAVHAAVIAPDDVTIYTYPCIPDYDDKNKVVLVFPGETATTLFDLAKELVSEHKDSNSNKPKKRACDQSENVNTVDCTGAKQPRFEKHKKDEERNVDDDKKQITPDKLNTESSESGLKIESEAYFERNQTIDCETQSAVSDKQKHEEPDSRPGSNPSLERVVFIDSTWNQTKTICNDERLKGLQCIELKTQETKFWRHQKDIPNTYLSTVEAIYYFLREYHEHFIQTVYNSEYDNLLFFFSYMYRKIRTLYDGGNELKAYKKRSEK